MMLAAFRRLFKGKPIKSQCNAKVRWVAEAIYISASFQDRAHSAATELGPEAIETLAELFHSEHTPPPELKDQFPGLGQWISARQFAIFEIFYFCGAPALSVLRRTAFGEYDWTQGNAIEILCRLAADGIESGQIIEELKTHLPAMREEAHYYAAGPLAKQAKGNVKLNEIVNQLLMVPEFKESYEHVVQSA
jgi:hypothetical protein